MNAREIITMLRVGGFIPVAEAPNLQTLRPRDAALLADLAAEGLESLRELVESEGLQDGEWWNVSHEWIGGANEEATKDAIALLDRAGEIERKPGEPHLVRFKA